MSPPLDELYLIWLTSLVSDPNIKEPSLTYHTLLEQLYTKEFIWVIPNDDNRVADGLDIRAEFVRSQGLGEVDPSWLGLGCSMLELMIGLSRRLSFEAEGEPDHWFWKLVQNLGLSRYNDSRKRYPRSQIDAILDAVIWRTYDYNGLGGFFPLRDPPTDQRREELWYQLCHYILERD